LDKWGGYCNADSGSQQWCDTNGVYGTCVPDGSASAADGSTSVAYGDPCDTSDDCGEEEYCDQESGSCVWPGGRRLSEGESWSPRNRSRSSASNKAAPHRRLLTGDDDDPNPYSRFPGDARDSRLMPNVQQIFVRDFNLDGKPDLFLHAPALSPGSCAQRCHALGRFGYDSFEVHRTGAPLEDAHEKSYCYCGPHYNQMVAPHPPPSPPKPPPYPPNPPPPEPVPSPLAPPPSPPFP
tara:strand:+ start:728 stop:1438 length:711 start_codon:yes stop_codon:yes gene_type:complete